MGHDKKKNQNLKSESPIIYPHGRPVTRRELLRAGAIQFTAAMAMPTILEMLAHAGVAEAAALCDNSSGGGLATFVHLSLAGGAAMGANFIPHDAGGQLLPTYNILGLGSSSTLTVTKEFANQAPFAGANLSGMIIGIRGAAQLTTLARSVFVGVPVRSQDDSASNKMDITGAVTRVGFKGSSFPNLGTVGSPTGGRHLPALLPPPAPLIVNSYDDLANAINVAGSLGRLSANQKSGLFRLINRLTTTQARTLAGMSAADQVATLTQCATSTNSTLAASGSTGTSPLENTAFATVWGLNNNTSKADRNFVFGSMVYNALKGNSGTVNLNLGGYDYHGNARTNTNAQDQAAGQVIGRVLQSAAVMQRRLFLVVTSDGAVGSPASDSAAVSFSSDRGSGSVAYMMAYDPAKVPAANGFQVGQFTNGQAADDKFVTGDNPELAAAAIFANYLSFNGRLSDMDRVVPRVFNPDQLTSVVKIAG